MTKYFLGLLFVVFKAVSVCFGVLLDVSVLHVVL